MNKKIGILAVLTAMFIFFHQGTNAQVNGVTFVNAGIGFGSLGYLGTGGLPIALSVEHGITDQISVGGSLGYVQRKYYDDYKYTYLLIGVRGSYHFNELLNIDNPKVDTYGGATLAYRRWSWNDVGSAKYNSGGVTLGIHVGGRYFLAENVGLFGELGYGIAALSLGLALKF